MLDWRALPLRLAATLAAGLPEDSRSKMHGQTIPLSIYLAAATLDAVQRLEWRLCGCPGKEPPKSVLDALTADKNEQDNGIQAFEDGAAFDAALSGLMGGEP